MRASKTMTVELVKTQHSVDEIALVLEAVRKALDSEEAAS